MTVKQVAAMTGLSERQILYMGERGKLTMVRPAKRGVRFIREEVLAWMDGCEAEAKEVAAKRRLRSSSR